MKDGHGLFWVMVLHACSEGFGRAALVITGREPDVVAAGNVDGEKYTFYCLLPHS